MRTNCQSTLFSDMDATRLTHSLRNVRSVVAPDGRQRSAKPFLSECENTGRSGGAPISNDWLRVRRRRLADLVRADASANEPSSGPRGTGRVAWRAPAETFRDSLLPRCRTQGRVAICTIKIASPRTFARDSASPANRAARRSGARDGVAAGTLARRLRQARVSTDLSCDRSMVVRLYRGSQALDTGSAEKLSVIRDRSPHTRAIPAGARAIEC